MSDTLLSVEDLRTHIHTDDGLVRAVDGISFDIDRGETVCLVGESGSGKTMTCDTLSGLVETPPAEVTGSVRFDGEELVPFDETDFRSIRGAEIGYAFQNARSALDPVYTVGDQIIEAIRLHRDVSTTDARERAIDLLETVGISPADSRVDEYPHQFSDGMCQRVALAIALAAEPALLIADEPTSALDVTIQARIIDLIDDLRADRDLALLLVTHDLRVVAALADRVVVMYAGTVVERGPIEDVFANPAHPYTQALFESFTGDGDPDRESLARDALPTEGCRFHPRCPAIIPPEEVALPREHWQGVVAFRFRLEREWADAAELRASLLRELPPAERTDSDLDATVRAAFDLPDEVADTDVESALGTAIGAIAADDIDEAREALADVATSVCERESPSPDAAETKHPVSCHRYDPSLPGNSETGIDLGPSEE
ncbi:ABC transporter ATP-binding protein [Natronomonas halophila]|uniref:ABC transporter ATP-binding protein n=1 Tax=Natronomonas halophila TaxID=2747817 RepID=UPI0015B60C4D|nr:ABC transporter ATP-binding protein [Natronomonas halophila]QLD84864.1 ABC transporter ATP-binding protein [Natronomonas halophila]